MNRDRHPRVAWLRSHASSSPYRCFAAAIAILAGLVVLAIAHEVFPYHSSNHDEGVYLQQAAMLLEGRLFLTPGSEPVLEAVHPWFFVEGETGLYPKYAPVPAAFFAAGMAIGDPRLSLGVVAAANVGLMYLLATATFDRRTGVVAAATMAAAPLFLLTSAAFLPYAPTTALNLLFAVAYVRTVRRSEVRYAGLAGAALGFAFFARPFTAVLFATPFVFHAVWRTVRTRGREPTVLVEYGLMSAVATAFVAVTLAYNALVTGSPLLFPYEAFAPRDGLGFGTRAILGHERLYTPRLAIHANAIVLRTFLTDWFTAGFIGAAFAVGGLLVVLRGLRRHGIVAATPLASHQLQLVLVGVIVTVVAGNLLFWGNLNILGALDRPDDGLIGLFGPIYHFDLLVPLSAFAGHGLTCAADGLRRWLPSGPRFARVGGAVLLVVSVATVGAVQAEVVGQPIERNAAYTEKYDRAYAPFQSTDLAGALVFLPPTYGEWQNHPYQWLRNDPGLDGPTVYAIARNPADDWAVVDAYPGRTVYRYRYHGVWTPDPHRHVHPRLERLHRVDGSGITARTTVSIPERIVSADVGVAVGGDVRRYGYEGDPPSTLTVNWSVTADGVTVSHPNLTSRSGESTPPPLDRPEEVVLTITIEEPGGGTLTYREELLARPSDDGVQVLWSPASSACPLVTDCGFEGTYLPDRPDTRPSGIAMNTTLAGGDP